MADCNLLVEEALPQKPLLRSEGYEWLSSGSEV